jgi:hypothetical protein
MGTQADILLSMTEELRRIDRVLRTLSERNCARVTETRAHIADSRAQVEENKPARKNTSFLH